jgi:hypothetical protein
MGRGLFQAGSIVSEVPNRIDWTQGTSRCDSGFRWLFVDAPLTPQAANQRLKRAVSDPKAIFNRNRLLSS